ncbi:MAG: protein kinase [Paludibacteraceae bacterium]|nr:protein kinase [Paludibacteraceae bacterium]
MKELHLFIIWERGRYAQDKILTHIEEHFSVVKIYDVLWSPSLVALNFSRFYGTKLPDRSFKEKECGRGRFLLVIVYDEHPIYQKRFTSKGEQLVNVNMFDAKSLYRKWTGGGHKIHATNSPEETNHDITLLLGLNTEDFIRQIAPVKEIDIIHKDLVGATGWKSISQLFYVMNNCMEYVVLRNWECLPEQYTLAEHGDIDILVYDRENAVFVLNATKIHKDPKRVAYNVLINNTNVPFDVRYIGDNYYCSHWQYQLLENIIYYKNIVKVLDPQNHLYTLLYHGLIHKWEIKKDYVETILRLAKQLGVELSSNFSNATDVLVNFMQHNGYEFIKPNDDSVIWNIEYKPVSEYINRFNGVICSYNAFPCNHIWYVSKVFKCDGAYIKVGSKANIDNEYQCLKQLQRYDCFPKIISHRNVHGEFCLEIEAIDGINMSDYFHKSEHLNKRHLNNFILQCVDILTILKKEHIAHRDISPEQFLITNAGKVYLIDFGWARRDVVSRTVSNSLIIPPPAICGARYKVNGDATTDFQMFATMLIFWFKNMPYLKQVEDVLFSVDDNFETVKEEVKKSLDSKYFTLKDYYILIGKGVNKSLSSKVSKYINIAKKSLRFIKRSIKKLFS